MVQPRLIITHGGQHHADECLAIALLKLVFGNVDVERRHHRYITVSEDEDPDIWILDMGGQFIPELHNFDHHHDASLESTNMLVLDYLVQHNMIDPLFVSMIHDLFKTVSDIDRHGYDDYNGTQVNAMIKLMSYDGAVAAFEDMLRNIDMSNIKLAGKYWSKRKEFQPRVFIVDDQIPVEAMKYMDPLFGDHYDIMISRNPNGYTVYTTDAKKFPLRIISATDTIHNGKFIGWTHDLWTAKKMARLASISVKE